MTKKRLILLNLLGLICIPGLFSTSSLAVMQGEIVREAQGARAFVVRVESARGELCSGVLVASDIVLTAAHCVDARGIYTIVGVTSTFRTLRVKSQAAAIHPDFMPSRYPQDQNGVDLALLLLEAPFEDGFEPLPPSRFTSLSEGQEGDLYGFGVTSENARGTSRTLRRARLVASGLLQTASSHVQVLVDPQKQGIVVGKGSCHGDSGGPVLTGGPYASDYHLAGIVSWSARPAPPRGCGGMTAITPISPHTSWITNRIRSLRDASQNAGTPAALLGGQYDWTVR